MCAARWGNLTNVAANDLQVIIASHERIQFSYAISINHTVISLTLPLLNGFFQEVKSLLLYANKKQSSPTTNPSSLIFSLKLYVCYVDFLI